jgi:hypothetical protein
MQYRGHHSRFLNDTFRFEETMAKIVDILKKRNTKRKRKIQTL